ncbi:MAG: response regulator [Methanomicrobium sp.]|nr:response regulator [Methanomicrobium sp.]MDD4299174.1 response regulator [Methanomicrobium sp.]
MNCLRILLMDDEAPILDIMSVFLSRGGYDVVCSKSGTQALGIFKNEFSSGSRFDLAILDVSIPGDMGAKELLKPMRETDPDIKVIITSGDSVQGAMDDPEKYGFSGSLKKPFRSGDLLRLVQELLNE